MKKIILKPGTYELANGKKQPGADVGRFVLDFLQSKGFLETKDCCNYDFSPRTMTTVERNLLTPINNIIIFNSTVNKFQGWTGTIWTDLN